MPNEGRERLVQQVVTESRRHYAAYTLFNQALADHLGSTPPTCSASACSRWRRSP